MPRGIPATDPNRLNHREAKALAREIEDGDTYHARVEVIAQGVSVVDLNDPVTHQTIRIRNRRDFERLMAGRPV